MTHDQERDERPEEERLLDTPTGGPEAQSADSDRQLDVDPSAGAGGQDDAGDRPEGAVEEAAEQTDGDPAPG